MNDILLYENNEHYGVIEEGIEKFLDKVDLTDEQRQEIISHFNKYPNKTKLVNWHKKDLSYNDIKKAMETTSKRQKKKTGGKKGKDYIEGVDSRGQYNEYYEQVKKYEKEKNNFLDDNELKLSTESKKSFHTLLQEALDKEEIIYHTLEMFGDSDDFKTSPFLTYDGDYIGKGNNGKKIAKVVLKRLNIKNDLATFLNKTKSVNVESKGRDIVITVLENTNLSPIQVNMLTDIMNNNSGNVIVQILSYDNKIKDKKIFRIFEINKLKRYLRNI